METVFAFCITGLFSVWVWSLKSEVSELSKRQPLPERKPLSPSPFKTFKHLEGDGSMIWTIES